MCLLRYPKRKGVGDSDLYYFKDKGSIKTTIIITLSGTVVHFAG